MKNVDLTQERLKEVLHYEPETGLFFWKILKPGYRSPGKQAGGLNAAGYCRIGIDFNDYVAHRLVWLYVYGRWPTDCLDHINGIRTDNRLANLREVTRRENNFNVTAIRSASGYIGVYLDKRRGTWFAAIKADGKLKALGRYKTPEAAHEAYQKAKRELHVIPG